MKYEVAREETLLGGAMHWLWESKGTCQRRLLGLARWQAETAGETVSVECRVHGTIAFASPPLEVPA